MKADAKPTSLYHSDFVHWVQMTVEQLRSHAYAEVDWANLIEEIEDMSRRERKALRSNLRILLLHLLKWQYQSEHRSGSWKSSIREHRQRIHDDLDDSPSLRPYLTEILHDCYVKARLLAADETELAKTVFPAQLPYSVEQILDGDFLPEAEPDQD
ncbi:MAG: DUF29 domain-containing protein [Cyanobacteria bacterium J06628_6]